MDFALLFQAVLALIFVIGLVFLVFWLMKFCESKGLNNPFLRKMKLSNRLSVIESKRVDARTCLVLARCDDEEYLLLVGNGQNILLKTTKGSKK
ncbi:MAG: FliO/MopB family protein [Alphaproteobacteria bacterium]|nr:FliO/MopB family protein [Alphaproteobacteria bacterium]